MIKKTNKVARTKFDMAVELVCANWRSLPWLDVYEALSKSDLTVEYNLYRSSKNLPLNL